MGCHRWGPESLTCDLQQRANGALRAGNSEASVSPAPFTLEKFNDDKQFRIVSISVKYPLLRAADMEPNMWAVMSGLP